MESPGKWEKGVLRPGRRGPVAVAPLSPVVTGTQPPCLAFILAGHYPSWLATHFLAHRAPQPPACTSPHRGPPEQGYSGP